MSGLLDFMANLVGVTLLVTLWFVLVLAITVPLVVGVAILREARRSNKCQEQDR